MQLLLANWQQWIGKNSMPIFRAKPGVWCDYCKGRFPKGNILHEKPASWTVVSEHPDRKGMFRSYCQACAEECCWVIDGEDFDLRAQLDYAQKNERLNYHGI